MKGMDKMDEEIKKDIVDQQLYWDSRVDASGLTVSVAQGKVLLGGTVTSFLERKAAHEDDSQVPGVNRVENQVTVKLSLSPEKDSRIRSNVEQVLASNPELIGTDLRVSVNNGHLVLEGLLNDFWKKVHAEELTSHVRGITELTNRISVVLTERFENEQIARGVMSALERHAALTPGEAGVKVGKGVVTLSGNVHDWAAKTAAFLTAVCTKGVVHVDDRLNVTPG
jgi:osmotically-inducible protein OsmY